MAVLADRGVGLEQIPVTAKYYSLLCFALFIDVSYGSSDV
jgi:hypothetical protein